MIWFRAALVAVVVGLGVAAFGQVSSRSDTPSPPTTVPPATSALSATPAPAPTRVPLPTLAPESIISRVSRATPAPPPVSTPSAQPQVAVVDYGFSPQILRIQPGTSITWSNGGNDGHDVTGTGPGGDWRSGPLAPSEQYTRAFSLPGTYAYVCTMHPEMRGQIIVQS